jgi:hypothetical protein
MTHLDGALTAVWRASANALAVAAFVLIADFSSALLRFVLSGHRQLIVFPGLWISARN